MKKALLILAILVLTVLGQSRAGLADSNETGVAAEAAGQADCSESAAEVDQGDSTEARAGYQTLRGQLYDIGTGEAPMLVFKAENGDYLVSAAGSGSADPAEDNTGADISQDAAGKAGGDAGDNTIDEDDDNAGNDYAEDATGNAGGDVSAPNLDKLGKLKGLPLLLTGRVSLFDGGSFDGQIEVEDYNTYYDKNRDGISESSKDSSGDNNDTSQDSSGDNSSDGSCKCTWEEVAILGRLVAGEDSLVLLSKDQVVIELDPDSYHSLEDYSGGEVVITGSLELLAEFRGQMEVKSYQVLSGD